jgi:hypothetical protein
MNNKKFVLAKEIKQIAIYGKGSIGKSTTTLEQGKVTSPGAAI